MKTKTPLLSLLFTGLALCLASCSENQDVQVNNERTTFPEAIVIKELTRINLIAKKPIETAQIIRTQEELFIFFDAGALAALPELNSINFSEQTLLLNSTNTNSHITSLTYTYTKTGDSTYNFETEASGIPVVGTSSVTYGIIVKKLPLTAKVAFSFEEASLNNNATDEEETKKFWGTWKTDYDMQGQENILIFKEDGTIGQYNNLDGRKYYVSFNNILQIEQNAPNLPISFEYEFLSDTELMIYNFTRGFDIDNNAVKDILFAKSEDITPCNLQTEPIEGYFINNFETRIFIESSDVNIPFKSGDSFISYNATTGIAVLAIKSGGFTSYHEICNLPESIKDKEIPTDGLAVVLSGPPFRDYRDHGINPTNCAYHYLELTFFTYK